MYRPDLEAYFQRIDDDGPRTPNLQTLRRIVRAHSSAIPFENLDILLGKGISLDPTVVERKLVHDQRGGYCFEQNSLMLHVLLALGYDVTPISARVRLRQERSFTPPRTHLFLRLDLEGQDWLVDVGVGALTPTCPLRLKMDTPQTTPHETRRIVSAGHWTGFEQRSPDAVLYHQVLLGDNWEDVCEFTLEPMRAIDRELGNWFTSTHPDSGFCKRLTIARATEDGRLTLLNREFKQQGPGAIVQTRSLHSDAEILSVLQEHFGLHFPVGTRFECEGLLA
jgi:N-hydroxyarylamine O-acetyltransferase